VALVDKSFSSKEWQEVIVTLKGINLKNSVNYNQNDNLIYLLIQKNRFQSSSNDAIDFIKDVPWLDFSGFDLVDDEVLFADIVELRGCYIDKLGYLIYKGSKLIDDVVFTKNNYLQLALYSYLPFLSKRQFQNLIINTLKSTNLDLLLYMLSSVSVFYKKTKKHYTHRFITNVSVEYMRLLHIFYFVDLPMSGSNLFEFSKGKRNLAIRTLYRALIDFDRAKKGVLKHLVLDLLFYIDVYFVPNDTPFILYLVDNYLHSYTYFRLIRLVNKFQDFISIGDFDFIDDNAENVAIHDSDLAKVIYLFMDDKIQPRLARQLSLKLKSLVDKNILNERLIAVIYEDYKTRGLWYGKLLQKIDKHIVKTNTPLDGGLFYS
jgi:hypothetical protein